MFHNVFWNVSMIGCKAAVLLKGSEHKMETARFVTLGSVSELDNTLLCLWKKHFTPKLPQPSQAYIFHGGPVINSNKLIKIN